jgi:hypothetical protein
MTKRQRRISGRTQLASRRRRRRRLAGARKVLERILLPVRRDVFVFSEIVARQPEVARVLS